MALLWQTYQSQYRVMLIVYCPMLTHTWEILPEIRILRFSCLIAVKKEMIHVEV